MAVAETEILPVAGHEAASNLAVKLSLLGVIAHRSQTGDRFNRPTAEHIGKVLRATRASGLLLRALLPDYGKLIGVGSRSFVFDNGDLVEKKEYVTAGMSNAALAHRTHQRRIEYNAAVDQFGRLVHPTAFDVGQLKIRPAGTFDVSRAQQDTVRGGIDLFSPLGMELLRESGPESQLRQEAIRLADGTRDWRSSGQWLDVMGGNNVMIMDPTGDAHLAIIDADQYPTSMDPSGHWHQRAINRIDDLERTAAHHG